MAASWPECELGGKFSGGELDPPERICILSRPLAPENAPTALAVRWCDELQGVPAEPLRQFGRIFDKKDGFWSLASVPACPEQGASVR